MNDQERGVESRNRMAEEWDRKEQAMTPAPGEKAWQARTEKTAARRLAAQFEQEARELGAAARLLRRRAG